MQTSTLEPMRRPAHNGDEQDAFSRTARRHGPAALQRAGVVHRTKTRAARRVRHARRQELRATARGYENLLAQASSGDLEDIMRAWDALDA